MIMDPRLHDPQLPRHGRIFEMLRHENIAQTTAERLDDMVPGRVDPEVAARLRRDAGQSLKRLPPLDAPEPILKSGSKPVFNLLKPFGFIGGASRRILSAG